MGRFHIVVLIWCFIIFHPWESGFADLAQFLECYPALIPPIFSSVWLSSMPHPHLAGSYPEWWLIIYWLSSAFHVKKHSFKFHEYLQHGMISQFFVTEIRLPRMKWASHGLPMYAPVSLQKKQENRLYSSSTNRVWGCGCIFLILLDISVCLMRISI